MVLKFLIIFLLVVFSLFLVRKLTWPPNPYATVAVPAEEIPTFKEISIDFVHKYDKSKSLPFMPGAIFELGGEQHIFVGGGYNQPDEIFVYRNGVFVNITQSIGLTKGAHDTTYGVVAIDSNGDGLVDLFIARESGVYLYTNNKGIFSEKKLDIPLDPKHAPISIAAADLQKKGLVDLFICSYVKVAHVEGQTIFNKKGYGGQSLLLKNNGDNTFTDITKEANLSYTHNTFQAAFVDLDGNNQLDLVIAYDTGTVRTYKNLGNLTFKMMPNPTTQVYSYPMGIAVGDYNGNDRPDLFFSNIGPFYWWNIGATPPNLLVRGDLKKNQYLLRKDIFLKNEGDFKFTDVATQTKTADYGFGWGTLFQDFTHKGYPDIVLAQNYVGWPLHALFKLPCRFLLQRPDHTFVPVEKAANVVNPYYAISPLIADFTNNGFPDLVYTNLNGPLRVFLNQGNKNNFIKIILKNEPASIGAKIVVETESGKKITSFFVPAQGLCTSQTNQIMIGIGKEKAIKMVLIHFTNGIDKSFVNPEVNSTIKL